MKICTQDQIGNTTLLKRCTQKFYQSKKDLYAYVDYNGKNVGEYRWKKNDLNLEVTKSWNPDSEMVLNIQFKKWNLPSNEYV